MRMHDEYFQHEQKYQEIYDKVCILMQVGIFYELYGKKENNEIYGPIVDQVTKVSKSIEENKP